MHELNPDLIAAYDRDCTDMTLVGAMADDARERGLDDLAEFLDWVREKRVAPKREPSGVWGWYATNYLMRLPDVLWQTMSFTDGAERQTAHQQLRRVWIAWRACSRERINAFWEWDNPYPLPTMVNLY